MTHLPTLSPGSTRQCHRQRVLARGELVIGAEGDITHLFQQGAARIRMPARHARTVEAVLMNTAGGLTGGDSLSWQVDVASGARLTLTTAACEKIYRAAPDTAPATLDVHLSVAAGARLDWLPQETILFQHSRLARTLHVALQEDAELLLLEPLLLGRRAMGEVLSAVSFRDQWRICRDGSLLHAEAMRIDSSQALTGRAALDGYWCTATLLLFSARGAEALSLLAERLRSLPGIGPSAAVHVGISVLEGRLVLRLLASGTLALRRAIREAVSVVRTDAPLPRVWQC